MVIQLVNQNDLIKNENTTKFLWLEIIEFENALSKSEDKNLIIAGHFPLVIQSKPSFKDFILPFPIVGSFTSSFHQNIGGSEDIVNELFNPIRKKLLKKIPRENFFNTKNFNLNTCAVYGF